MSNFELSIRFFFNWFHPPPAASLLIAKGSGSHR
jgi:hypothetical protein